MNEYSREELYQKFLSLNLSDDYIFAKVMSDPKICKEFLE